MLTPPLIPSMPTLRSGPLLTSERLRTALEVCGYQCAPVQFWGAHVISPGCSIALQLGDVCTKDSDGQCCLTVRCGVQINGSYERVGRVTGWQSRKMFSYPVVTGVGPSRFAVEIDVLLGADVALGDVLPHGGDVYRHLHRLIADACDVLRDMAAERKHGDASAPIVRIEAKVFGDLVVGRSGLVMDGRNSPRVPLPLAAQHLQDLRAACDRLKDAALPELAMALRRITLRTCAGIEHPGSEQASPLIRASGDSLHEAASDGDDSAVTLAPDRQRSS